jgi:hypothetical protein
MRSHEARPFSTRHPEAASLRNSSELLRLPQAPMLGHKHCGSLHPTTERSYGISHVKHKPSRSFQRTMNGSIHKMFKTDMPVATHSAHARVSGRSPSLQTPTRRGLSLNSGTVGIVGVEDFVDGGQLTLFGRGVEFHRHENQV